MNSQVLRPWDREITVVIEVVGAAEPSCSSATSSAWWADRIDRCLHHEECVVLRSMTAIVGVGSRAGLYVAFSYDDSLIRAMTRRYTAELSIAPEEEDLYVRETASDVVNVIIGK